MSSTEADGHAPSAPPQAGIPRQLAGSGGGVPVSNTNQHAPQWVPGWAVEPIAQVKESEGTPVTSHSRGPDGIF